MAKGEIYKNIIEALLENEAFSEGKAVTVEDIKQKIYELKGRRQVCVQQELSGYFQAKNLDKYPEKAEKLKIVTRKRYITDEASLEKALEEEGFKGAKIKRQGSPYRYWIEKHE